MSEILSGEDEAKIRLTLANATVRLWIAAYDALLVHGVNIRKLPEFNDTSAIDKARTLPISEGRALIVRWLGRVHSALHAATRRKGFKVIE